MLKSSKSNNHFNLNKQIQIVSSVKRSPRYQNEPQNKNVKKFTKMKKANSIINFKDTDKYNHKQILPSKKYSNITKYHKIEKTSENKEKSKNKSNKSNKNNKYIIGKNKNIKIITNSKENKNFLNCISGRKSSLPKQISFVSKISNDNLPSTIDNEYNDYKEIKNQKNSEKKNGNFLNKSNFQNNKNNLYNQKNNIYDYQIYQLKKILIKKPNIENNFEKIISNKFKNKQNNNYIKNKNYSNNISKNNHLINANLTSFSPIQKNNNFYKMSSQHKNIIFSNTNTNPNINYIYDKNKSSANSQKLLNINNKNIEDNKLMSENKYKNKKVTEKSCPMFNINNNSIKNIKDPYIIEDNLNKNSSAGNIILRNTAGPYLNSIKGALKPFCSLININIPINNKSKKDENEVEKKNNSNDNNNYLFDKDKYFNDFKNKINLNINNLFFKTKRKKWKNIIENKSKNTDYKDICTINNDNYLSEDNNNNCEHNNCNNNDVSNKIKIINNLLTEQLNKNGEKNDKIVRIKKIKSINLTNNVNNKNFEIDKEDFILNDMFLKKRKARKRSSDIESYPISSLNIRDVKNKNNNNKSSFVSFNRRTINENNKKNYNSYFINFNSTNGKGRNDNNILINNFFEPQTTVYQKNYFYKNKNNNNINSNSNRNNYTQNSTKDTKSHTIIRKKDNFENKKINNSTKNRRNIDNEIINNDANETNYLKILFDELTKFKKAKKGKKRDLEICFLNNSNKANNNFIENMNLNINKKKKENKTKMKIEVDENKIKENISQNTLSMYTIYILSKYYPNCNKIGLMKINLFDKDGNNIPVVCSNTNSNSDNCQNPGNENLFNSKIETDFLYNKTINNDKPFIMQFKKNLYINFYIKNIKSNNIDYIQIINYADIKNNISPIKNIHIFRGKELIYKGILSEKNIINKIPLNNNNTHSSMMLNCNYRNMNNIDNIKQRPLSSSKPRYFNNIQITKSSTYRKSEFNEYYRKSNIFNKSHRNNYIFSDNNYNETNINDKKIKAFMYSTKKHSANDIRNTKVLTGNLRQELNISNTYTINNLSNCVQKTFLDMGDKFMNQNINEIKNNNNRNKNNEQKLFFNSINKSKNYLDFNLSNNSNEKNKKSKNTCNRINGYDNNSGEKIFMRSNSEKKFKKSLIKTQKSLLFQKINEEKKNDINFNEIINNTYINRNNNSQKNNNNIYNNKKYIEFNKIHFEFVSNYGHNKYIGLTGIEFYNLKGDLVNIESASSIGALPKDLKTIYDEDNETRIFENVFNNFNNTNEVENMWVTLFNKNPPFTFIELYFEERIRLSRIKIYNYNERNKLEIGVKTINLYLDDKFYDTINIKQGTGEIGFDYITLNNDNNCSNGDFDKFKNYDFGQNITFPIIEDNASLISDINKFNNLLNNSKFASFLYEQNYETPYMPSGYYIQFQFFTNYYKDNCPSEESNILQYKDIGLDNIEIYDNEGRNILIKNNINFKNNYKLISNCEIFHNDDNKIILNGTQNENCNNSIFYIFEKNIQISYIKFYPLTKNENDKIIKSLNSVKEIKVFCEKNIIFEGDLYIEHPTIVLFTCDSKITKNINEEYLTKYNNNREYKEVLKEEYISLVLN